MNLCSFGIHNWSKWSKYIESGEKMLCGLLTPKNMLGKIVPYSEEHQKRGCKRCGKIEDELIKG
jgi:hypothetical protein